VRFHAAQSIVVFLGLQILQAVLGPIFGMGWWVGRGSYWGAFTLGTLLLNLISMVSSEALTLVVRCCTIVAFE
jgi:uncharacterized membrane protein